MGSPATPSPNFQQFVSKGQPQPKLFRQNNLINIMAHPLNPCERNPFYS